MFCASPLAKGLFQGHFGERWSFAAAARDHAGRELALADADGSGEVYARRGAASIADLGRSPPTSFRRRPAGHGGPIIDGWVIPTTSSLTKPGATTT
jgi:hypothetical protein